MADRMPTAHPDHDMLAAYAAGSASEGVALLVATHLTFCPTCRTAVADIEAIGAALMAGDAASAVDTADDSAALAAVLGRLDAAPAADRAPVRDALLPRPLREAIGVGFGDIRWRFAMPGVSRADIAAGGAEQAMLLRVRPGVGVPAHTHTAVEATLVLSGALRDRGRIYRPGDLSIATSDDDHDPRAEPGGDCVCLAVMSGSLRFTGRLGRALNLFAE